MPITVDGEEYLTAAEVSKHLGVSRDTFYKSVRNRLKAYKLGVLRRNYYKKADVNALQGARPVEDK